MRTLFAAGRFAGAHYMCGYAMEMKLKTHEWTEYPPRSGERLAQALKTHKLGDLLLLTGMERTILAAHGDDWSAVIEWDPEQRYRPGAVAADQAQTMIRATAALMAAL